MKSCSKCKVEKDDSCFAKDKQTKDGLTRSCKECRNANTRRWNASHKQYLYDKQVRWCNANPVRKRERYRKYVADNADAYREYRRNYEKARRNNDPNFRLTKNLRSRLNDVLCGRTKTGSAISDLGCSVQHLKLHLELFWDEGMSWSNYGNKPGQWSIDHIKPLSLFDLTDRSQLLQAVHYTNLQPLWHVDNLAKSDNYICG